MRAWDNVAQPVDWVLLVDPIGLTDKSRLLFRTISALIQTHGRGVSGDFVLASRYGLFNVLIAADGKAWASQIIDHTIGSDVFGAPASDNEYGVSAVVERDDRDPTKVRIRDATGAMIEALYNQVGVLYGDPADSSVGTYLVGDLPVDWLHTSEAVQGRSFTVMLFGHAAHRRHTLRIEDLVCGFRVLGGARRRRLVSAAYQDTP